MQKYFNTTGPCNGKEHYIVPVLERRKEIMLLVDRAQYFVIHAARQTGKTTLLHHLVSEINNNGNYYALYCSLEAVQAFKDADRGIPQILSVLKKAVKFSSISGKENFGKNLEEETVSTLINVALTEFCISLDKPLIILFDEIDGLEDETLVTFLRQLRDGYVTRFQIPFIHSTGLVGLRDVRDYKSKIREGRETLGSKSPFNIISETFTLNNFTLAQVSDLYQQHTELTGQKFKETAIQFIYEQSDGQPWLVNAIANEIIEKLLKNDFSKQITEELARTAIKNIILRRDTHIDSLLDKLKEKRVCKIIEPVILTTTKNDIDYLSDDLQYVIDLGLIKKEDKTLVPANKIYAEIIVRELSYNTQSHLKENIVNKWIDDGKIDMNALLKAFQEFWRENSGIWVKKYQYTEAAPHLIMQAFLQRVINGGGDILREYAYARKRIDLCIRFSGNKYPLELKIDYGKKTIPEGLIQLSEYMDGFGEKTGWLIVFDRNENKTWEEKIWWKTQQHEGKIIHIVGC